MMIVLLLGIFLLPPATLTTVLTKLPVLGIVPVIGLFLMVAGVAWALININSLPMVVDMTTAARIGTYTGLYYLFSTLSAIVGPNINGWIIQFSGNNYNLVMMVGPVVHGGGAGDDAGREARGGTAGKKLSFTA